MSRDTESLQSIAREHAQQRVTPAAWGWHWDSGPIFVLRRIYGGGELIIGLISLAAGHPDHALYYLGNGIFWGSRRAFNYVWLSGKIWWHRLVLRDRSFGWTRRPGFSARILGVGSLLSIFVSLFVSRLFRSVGATMNQALIHASRNGPVVSASDVGTLVVYALGAGLFIGLPVLVYTARSRRNQAGVAGHEHDVPQTREEAGK